MTEIEREALRRTTLLWIQDFQKKHDGVSPSVRELADGLHVTVKAAQDRLAVLERRGRLRKIIIDGRVRGLRVVA